MATDTDPILTPDVTSTEKLFPDPAVTFTAMDESDTQALDSVAVLQRTRAVAAKGEKAFP